MRHGIRSLLLLGLVLIIAGGHVAALQLVAWGGMLACRVQERSLAEAVASTFSGDEPCALCKAARALDGECDQPTEVPDVPQKTVKMVKVETPPPIPLRLVAQPAADGVAWHQQLISRLESLVWIPDLPPPRV